VLPNTPQQHKNGNGRSTGLDRLHAPTVPAPELVLSQLSSVQKLSQEMSRAAQSDTSAIAAAAAAGSSTEDTEVMTEYLVRRVVNACACSAVQFVLLSLAVRIDDASVSVCMGGCMPSELKCVMLPCASLPRISQTRYIHHTSKQN
jgi:hypothetical protein